MRVVWSALLAVVLSVISIGIAALGKWPDLALAVGLGALTVAVLSVGERL